MFMFTKKKMIENGARPEQGGDGGNENSTLLEVSKPGSWFGPPVNSDLNFSVENFSLLISKVSESDSVIFLKYPFSSKILNLDRALL